MKFLAIINVAKSADLQSVRNDLANELKASWELFASGMLREAYLTDIPTRVVFIIETDGRAQAEACLRGMPLIGSGSLVFELVELQPFVNWSLLFAR